MTITKPFAPEKILLIRMLSEGDVVAIGLPALRFFRQKFPQAELHLLTYGRGKALVELAEPDLDVRTLEHWPDDFFQAMETFLGLAEDIIGETYSQIVNLDTAFMPCFLARFLQDAGELVSGNYLSMSIQTLIDKVGDQSLQADYVNVPATYMLSSFFTMSRWFSNWALGDYLPEGGYPEFYLKQCCGFSRLEMDSQIALSHKDAAQKSTNKPLIALCLSQSADGYNYPHGKILRLALEQKGFKVWFDTELSKDISQLLRQLHKSDLMVGKPSAFKWFADAVACPSLLISGASDAKIFMPDYATDTTAPCPLHSGQLLTQYERLQAKCLCDDPELLADNIAAILQEISGTEQHD